MDLKEFLNTLFNGFVVSVHCLIWPFSFLVSKRFLHLPGFFNCDLVLLLSVG